MFLRSAARASMWLRAEFVGPLVQRSESLLTLLARVWRRLLIRTRFIVITGSLGKTTAKEVLGQVVATHGRVHRTWANQSGGRLVILNILRVRPWHRFAVLEMSGASPGALDRLAPVVRPDVVLQLGVNYTHSLNFEDLEARAREKGKLCAALGKSGIAVLNGDDPHVRSMQSRVRGRTLFFGRGSESDVWADQVSSEWPARLSFTLHAGDVSRRVETRLVGKHWLPSVLGPLAVVHGLGLDLAKAIPAVTAVQPFPGRLQPVRLPAGPVVLRDEYNASTPSLLAALEVMREASCKGRKVLVIRDFSDFSGHRRQRLRYLASEAAGAVDAVALIGESAGYGLRRFAEQGLDSSHLLSFASLREAAESLSDFLAEDDLVLVKGRTTDHLARLVHAWSGSIECWKEVCPKRMMCDECWELGAARPLPVPGQAEL